MRNFGLMLARRLEKYNHRNMFGGARAYEAVYWRPSARDPEADMQWHAQCSKARPDLWPEAGFRQRLAMWLSRKNTSGVARDLSLAFATEEKESKD